jgi:ketosteroid isomerase-like protein
MPEESATPDLVELTRRSLEAANRRDFDAVMSFYGPDPVWDVSPMGLGLYEGAVAVRGFFEDWIGAYEEWEIEPEEILEVGNGVVLAIFVQNARPAGSDGYVRLRYAAIGVWVQGGIARTTNYGDIDEARAAAERLAQERE